MHFESAADYFTALGKNKYAITPKSLAGKALGLSTAGITKRVEQGRLAEVEIDGRNFLLAGGVADSLEGARKLTKEIRKTLERGLYGPKSCKYGHLEEHTANKSRHL